VKIDSEPQEMREETPQPVERPKLAAWMFDRNLKARHAAPTLGCGAEQVRRYCLPFGDPKRVIPPAPVMERIVDWTRGEVTAPDFYPAKLRGQPEPLELSGAAL
jgi:hypothetical protein